MSLRGPIAVVIPAKDCADTVSAVLAALPDGVVPIVVDDGSAVPIAVPVRTVRHPVNRGYGAAQKSGYRAALDLGAERIVLLHGDGQYDVADTLALAEALDAPVSAALGSRFLRDPAVIPGWRRLGNRALTGLANLRFGTRHTELHSGARAFSAGALRSLPFDRFSDDYLFDQQLLVGLLRAGVPIAERPVRTKYDDTTQSISLRRSVVYGLGCVRVILAG
jgi:glycosyltransferase involved in cell wall biosynthesis